MQFELFLLSIGHRGQAISFFNERDEGIAPQLVKILLETGQAIPEFLLAFAPDDLDIDNLDIGKLQFEPDTDDDKADDSAVVTGADGGSGAEPASLKHDVAQVDEAWSVSNAATKPADQW